MQRLFALLAAGSLLFGSELFAQISSARVTIKLSAPTLNDSTKVYIAGSTPRLGSWNPSAVAMESLGNRTWQISFVEAVPTSIEYKLTLGSWDTEATASDGSKMPNFSVNVVKDTVVSLEVKRWSNGVKKTIVGGITGEVVYHKKLSGKGIAARDIVVWLPKGYHKSKAKRYPVLYLHDGQNIFDPRTSSFGADWRVDEAADSLIKAGKVAPFIVVGIYNTPDRMREYVPGELGSAYMSFVAERVKPFIDSAYRTKKEAKYNAVGGSSAGGIISFMLAWEYPNLFGKAICMSPAFKIEHIDYVKVVNQYQGPKKPLFFYIDNGGVGLEARLQPGIDDMLKALELKGYCLSKDYFWFKDEEAQHNEPAWAKRMPAAIELVMPRR